MDGPPRLAPRTALAEPLALGTALARPLAPGARLGEAVPEHVVGRLGLALPLVRRERMARGG